MLLHGRYIRALLSTRNDFGSMIPRQRSRRTRAFCWSRPRSCSPCQISILYHSGDDKLHQKIAFARFASSKRSVSSRSDGDETKKDTHQSSRPAAGSRSSTATPTTLSYRQQALTPPNLITLTRIACTPLLSYCIIHDYSTAALIGCFLAGTSDYIDGWLARHYHQMTALGTYLDPLADKILVNTLSISLWVQGILPTPLMALWLTRDVGLMVGSCVYVAHAASMERNGASASSSSGDKESLKQTATDSSTSSSTAFTDSNITPWLDNLPQTLRTLQVKPTIVSKANTALQFLTLGAAIASPMYMANISGAVDVLAYAACWDNNHMLQSLCWMTGFTTIASGVDYLNRDAFGRDDKDIRK